MAAKKTATKKTAKRTTKTTKAAAARVGKAKPTGRTPKLAPATVKAIAKEYRATTPRSSARAELISGAAKAHDVSESTVRNALRKLTGG